MGKVLKLHEQGSSGEDWFRSSPYGKNEIEQIIDPAGNRRQIVSVPTPFARFSIVDSALRFVTEKARKSINDLHGKTIHHQTISDFLDSSEAFFNFQNIKDYSYIYVYNIVDSIDELLLSKEDGHKQLGETLKLYIKDDPDHFSDFNLNLYFLIYRGKIIGSTSPFTLFVPPVISDREREDKIDKIKFDTYSLFDTTYTPLYQRESEFQKYFYGLFKLYPHLRTTCKNLYEYVEINFLQNKINKNIDITDYYENIQIEKFEKLFDDLDTGTPNQFISINKIIIKKRKIDPISIQERSSFIINTQIYPKKYPGIPIPMALQNEYSKHGSIYTSGLWNPKTKVPLSNQIPIENRILPDNSIKYPYITVDDLLEPEIFRLPYELNFRNYFNGNLKSRHENAYSYLLPIKKQYFSFFSPEDLSKNIFIEEGILESVVVRLRIPIRDGEVFFEKTYKKPAINRRMESTIDDGFGTVREIQFGLSIHPFVKVSDKSINIPITTIPYSIHLIDLEPKDKISLKFINSAEGETDIVKESLKREKLKQLDSKIFRVETPFDIIELRLNNLSSGIIIPLFKQHNGGKKYLFSVDFGTTNTHIEYIEPGTKHPVPFEIKAEDLQVQALHINNDNLTIPELKRVPVEDFMPDFIGKNSSSDCAFPQRTVIAERSNLSGAQETIFAPLDLHIPFLYEKIKINKEFYELYSNLKWDEYEESSENSLRNESRIEKFLEEIILLIQAKVLLNNGDLNDTVIYWFYPTSMTVAKKNKLKKIWNRLFSKYISPEVKNLILLSESIAPFYYYKNTNKVSASAKNVVSIDIGGGTTDIVIFKDNSPELLTSFKFASNSLFGDGYGGSLSNNGFIIEFSGSIETILENNQVKDLRDIFYSIRESNKSEDLIAFFFALDENKHLKNKNISIRFADKLANNREFKFVFFLYYAAIIYHIAKLMKASNLEMPGHLTFSGMGSKAINLVSEDDGTLSELSEKIFEKVYNLKYDGYHLEIIKAENPKEVTCKGALYLRDEKQNIKDLDNIKVIHLGTSEDILIRENSMKYGDKNIEIERSVVNEINTFFEFILSLHQESFNLERNLDINIKNITNYFKALGKNQRDLVTYLREGLKLKSKERFDENEVIEETFFFYPLVGSLNNLAYHISTKFKKMRAT